MSQRTRTRPSQRPQIVICRCKSHCTTFNPATGRYEGNGQLQTRPTRDNHSRDDRLLNLQSTTSLQPTLAVAPPPPQNPRTWVQQAFTECELFMSLPLSHPGRPFVFLNPPEENGAFVWPSDAIVYHPNGGLYALSNHRSNQAFLHVTHSIHTLLVNALRHPNQQSEDLTSLVTLLRHTMNQLMRLKEVEWSQQRGARGVDVPYVNTETYFQPLGPFNGLQMVSSILSLVLENIFFIPRRALRTLLGGSRSLLRQHRATDDEIAAIPIDPVSGSLRARLNPTTRQFVVCPNCHHLYPFLPGDNPRNQDNPFPLKCTNRRTLASPVCDAMLWKERSVGDGQTLLIPIRKYLHQDLKSWVGRLLSRRGMEEILDSCRVEVPQNPPSSNVHDIWSSNVFNTLKDADGAPFFPGQTSEGRLVFSLSVDSFNPFHNKTAKQSASSTGIWMVLLNLPQHLRYLHENMYVAGIIPGPDKPSKEDIYSYVELVINDLLEFWYPGVRFSRTEKHALGRLYKAMLIPLVCDMLAARQLIGLGSVTSHNFCTFCDVDIDDIHIADRREWPAKSQEHIRHIATLWRDASTVKEQELIFDSFGYRWSPLYRLPYWDPVRYTVVDPMHALDLNLFQNHCRAIFQIDTKYPGSDGASLPGQTTRKGISTRDQLRSLQRCVELIRVNGTDLITELIRHPRLVLYTICVNNDILGPGHQVVIGTKWVLANNIYAWRQAPGYSDVSVGITPALLTEDQETESQALGDETPGAMDTSLGVDARVVTRVIRHLLNVDDREASRNRAFTQGSAAIFGHICSLLDLETDGVDMHRRHAKRSLFDIIINTLDDNAESSEQLASYLPADPSSRVGGSRAVLGKDIMEHIWADMRQTQLPTWITPAPPNWGTTQRGKLSADNWRVVCTIHLPITLIQLWSNNTERKKQILDHFMDLVSSVQIANMRISSEIQIHAYNFFIERYVTNIQKLYPDQSLKPTHHAALHIGDMLGLFGPNHSHSGPHYERYINFFHHINTNLKLGELETTMLNTSARSANLRALLADNPPLRSSVLEMISVMEQIDSEDIRGFRLASILDIDSPLYTPRSKPQAGFLQTLHHQLLCAHLNRSMDIHVMPTEAQFMKEISKNGVCYGTSSTSTFKNSPIIFSTHNSESEGTPNSTSRNAGIIKQIFEYHWDEQDEVVKGVFFVVQLLDPIDPTLDPYRQYAFGGFLCIPTNRELVISLSQIKSHFALTRMVGGRFNGYTHVLPVDRLMLQFDTTDQTGS